MMFFFLMPMAPAVLGNFLIPLKIGAKDVAFPRINLFSWRSEEQREADAGSAAAIRFPSTLGRSAVYEDYFAWHEPSITVIAPRHPWCHSQRLVTRHGTTCALRSPRRSRHGSRITSGPSISSWPSHSVRGRGGPVPSQPQKQQRGEDGAPSVTAPHAHPRSAWPCAAPLSPAAAWSRAWAAASLRRSSAAESRCRPELPRRNPPPSCAR